MGTNLFSGVKTVTERDPNYIYEITKYSKFYNKVLVGDQSAPMMRLVPQWMPATNLSTK